MPLPWQLRHFCRLSAPSVDHAIVMFDAVKFSRLMQPDQVASAALGSYGGGSLLPWLPARSVVSFASQFVILLASSGVYVRPLWPPWIFWRIGASDEKLSTRVGAATAAL